MLPKLDKFVQVEVRDVALDVGRHLLVVGVVGYVIGERKVGEAVVVFRDIAASGKVTRLRLLSWL